MDYQNSMHDVSTDFLQIIVIYSRNCYEFELKSKIRQLSLVKV